ncbi:MAG: glycoside hydrolase family 32 protein [Anaerolineae bacterium]|nr:glycoside hydrolase family 32 protein [Anaerolineae bacterium]
MRPVFHFTPPANWMNDPNGLVFFDGEWHLFYQHNPYADTWGHMHWGHAVSQDLLHWTHLPIALHEDLVREAMIFSGSAAVDWHNTSHLGNRDQPPLIAAYTEHTKHEQAQCLAYSTDRGRTWTPFAENPVIAIGAREFRDPKLFWHTSTQRWVMACALPDQHKVRFYASADLRHWQWLSDFGPAGAVQGVWECPDLFPLTLDDGSGQQRWVLKVDDTQFGAQYFVGHFDGEVFLCDDPPTRVRQIDCGADFYAAQSWNDAPNRRHVWLAWMNNWAYAQRTPTTPWRGMMTAPRELALQRRDGEIYLVQRPIAELAHLRGAGLRCINAGFEQVNRQLSELCGVALELDLRLKCAENAQVFLSIRRGAAEETIVGYRADQAQLCIDRTRSGNVAFAPQFDGLHTAICPLREGELHLHVLIDLHSVELFADGGRVILSDLVFPTSPEATLSLETQGLVSVTALNAWRLG